MKTTEVPAIIDEAKAAGCENADQINGYLAGEVSRLRTPKPFLVFAFDHYYPAGGWHDFLASFDTPEEARERTKTIGMDCWQIVDSRTGTVVEER